MSATTDDPWADLYNELEVENAAKAATPPPLPVNTEDDGEDADDDPETGEGEGEVLAEGDAPPADGEQPRKRRRRRRRRKGKGANGEQLPADGEGLAATDGDDLPPEEVTEAEGEPDVAEPVEAAPDVIRGWNVPSWSEIVAGLYRPA